MLRAKERQARVQLKYREFFHLREFRKFSDKDANMLADAIDRVGRMEIKQVKWVLETIKNIALIGVLS